MVVTVMVALRNGKNVLLNIGPATVYHYSMVILEPSIKLLE